MTNMTYAQALINAIDAFAYIEDIDAVGGAEVVEATTEKLEALKAQLAKRGTSNTPTKTQKANEEIKKIILAVLTDNGGKMTVTEMLKDDRLSKYTNQKISALLRQLIKDGKVDKTVEKKKAYFTLVK